MSKVINLDDSRKKKEADRQKAMRLMEALSGVDAELLERSEGTVAAFPFWRYGKQLAVCFACMFLGVCAIGVYGVTTSNKSMNQSNYASLKQEAATMNEAPDTSGLNGGAQSPAEAEKGQLDMASEGKAEDVDKIAPFPDKAESNGTDGIDNEYNFVIDEETVTKEQDTEITVGLKDNREQITLEAAKAMERIGSYVPETIPAGYKFESARGSGPDNSYLDMSLCWSKGMDDIRLHITEFYAVASMPADVNDSFQKRIVDPAKTETYDVYLYEIPYAETVPKEYREIFDNPVFKESDLSLELVKARMKSIPDAGDTNTPRGRFAVLYDSGILVEFSGRGSAEEIWKMFQSIQP